MNQRSVNDVLLALPPPAATASLFTSLPADICAEIAWAWHDIAYTEGKRSDIRKLAAVNRFWREVCEPVVWETLEIGCSTDSKVFSLDTLRPHAHLVRRLVLAVEDEYDIPKDKGRMPVRVIGLCAHINSLDLIVTPSRGNSTRVWTTRLHTALLLLSTRVHVVRLFCTLSEVNSSLGYRTVGTFVNARHVSVRLYNRSGRDGHASLVIGSRKLHSLTTFCNGPAMVHSSSDAFRQGKYKNELPQLARYSTRISPLWPHYLPLIGDQAVVYMAREQLEYLAVDVSTTVVTGPYSQDPYTSSPDSCIPQRDPAWHFPRLKVFRERSSGDDTHNFSFLPYIRGAPLEHLRLDHLRDSTVQRLLDYIATQARSGLEVGYRLHPGVPLSDHGKQELVDLCETRKVTLIDCSDLPPWREEVDL